MSDKKNFQNKCFMPDWLEVDLRNAKAAQTEREEYLNTRRRKDLNILLQELEQIRLNIEKAAEKQHMLANLMSFYSGEFAK